MFYETQRQYQHHIANQLEKMYPLHERHIRHSYWEINLANTDLHNANLSDTDLCHVSLEGANLKDTKFQRVKCYRTLLRNTTLPDGTLVKFKMSLTGDSLCVDELMNH